MKINDLGINLIKQYEGLRLETYLDAVGVLTVGYGNTGPHVTPGLKITESQANKLLLDDIARFEKGVSDLVKTTINTNEFSALVCFSFNVGLSNLGNSTLLKLLNNNQKADAANQFLRWNKAGGKVLNGLTKRRKSEMDLFLTPC